MNGPIEATYYGPDASKPYKAQVQWASADVLEVRLPDRTEHWNLRATGTGWEISAGALRILHGTPPCTLLVRDPGAVAAWKAHFKAQRLKKAPSDRVPWLLTIPLALPLGFIALCVAAYLWVLPWVSERLAMRLPPDTDVSFGDAMFQQMRGTLAIDEEGSAQLQAFGDALALAPSFKLKLHLVKDEQVNAFALPGGHIVVYTGILDRMEKPGELAALLAHEGTHVERRHSTRALARDMSGTLFLSLLLGDLGGITGVLAQKGDELRGLSYSRDLETEADTTGQRRMHLNGVDPQGMVDLLNLLDREAKDVPEGMAFLSSHPLTKERIATATSKAEALGPLTVTPPALDSLFRTLRGSYDQKMR